MMQLTDEMQADLMHSIATISNVCSLCIEDDVLAVNLLSRSIKTNTVLLIALGIFNSDDAGIASTFLLEHGLEVRAAARSGKDENIVEVCANSRAKMDRIIDNAVLDQTEFDDGK